MGILRIAAASALAIGLALSTVGGADAASKKCVVAGGQGIGAGPDIAKLVAADALTEVLSKGGMKGSGKVSTKCDDNPLLTTCTATQKACK